jgi:glycosyltransferase involved in cell wall biosynthesis
MSRTVPAKKKMLYVGDFPVQTGFGVVSNNLIATFRNEYDLHIMGVNYYGDYDPLCEGLRVYPASLGGGDVWGKERLETMVRSIQPDVVFILNDCWIANDYMTVLSEIKDIPFKTVLYTPIDAENVKADFAAGLVKFDAVVSYTEFGKQQLDKADVKDVHVVPHGIDRNTFYPINLPKGALRAQMKLKEDDYIVLCLQRNQPRKRLDLTFFYFAEWVKRYDLPENVKIYYHGALQDFGIDIIQWCQYLGIENRLVISSPNITPSRGLTPAQLNMVYNNADVFFTTTAAEGWCLPVAEAMAVGVPAILPNHSALGEWPRPNAFYMDCYPFPQLTDRGLNTIHHVTEMESAINALHKMYTDSALRAELGQRALAHMRQSKFSWSVIGKQFVEIINGCFKNK